MGRDGMTEGEWGLGTKQTSHTLLLMVFVEWVYLAGPGWVCSSVTLWVDAFEVIKVLTGNFFMLS